MKRHLQIGSIIYIILQFNKKNNISTRLDTVDATRVFICRAPHFIAPDSSTVSHNSWIVTPSFIGNVLFV